MITLEGCIIEGETIGMFANNMPHDGLHEAHLEVERCLHPYECQLQQSITQTFRQPGDKTLQHYRELAIIEQVIKCLLHLPCLIWSYLVEFLDIVLHSGSKLFTFHYSLFTRALPAFRTDFPQCQSRHPSFPDLLHVPAEE